MYELDCHGVIPGCERVIRADSQAEVMRRAVMQAKQLGMDTITQRLMDAIRDGMHETVKH